ncbi:MAG: hypothetical protein MUC43_02385 [Pirellula sp.]|jgi:uncharacterized membrane protein|nr:hypothetical protein [Pirellula sp.]
MRCYQVRFAFLSACSFFVGLSFANSALAVEPRAGGNEFPIKVVKVGGVELEVVVNSDTFSQATAINANGSIIGTREVIGEDISILSQKSFYFGELGHKDMPIPETFTNVEATGISDTELVIGYATRPAGHPKGNLDAVTWDPKTDEIVVLPRAEGDAACQAQSVSSNGRMITGYSTGPARMRPVVWTKESNAGGWNVTVLPTIHENNPYLMSSHLRVTPDGSCIAGCCTEAFLPSNVIDSSLYLWTKDQQGEWKRQDFSERQLYVKGFNNKRQIVGVARDSSGKSFPCLINEKGQETKLSLLPGDETGEARAINESGLIVGYSDDPHGPEGGPEPCSWSMDGKVTSVKLGPSPYGTIHAINDAGQMAGMATLVELNKAPGVENGLATERALAFRTKRTGR